MIQTKIFDYGMNGEGVAKIDGKIVLINNALIDELVDVEIVEDNKNYSIGKVSKIISQSKNREIPPCSYFFECGGCQLQHMNYAEQLKFKTYLVKKTIKKITSLDVDVKDTIPCSDFFAYRNKMSFSVNKNICGLFKHNSKEIVNINSCPLANETINKFLLVFKEYLNSNKLDSVKNIVIRSINNQTLIGVVTSKQINLNDLFSTFNEHFNNFGLYQIVNTRKDSVVLSGKVIHVGGLKEIRITNSNLTYSVDLLGFHQTNLEIQNKIYDKVLSSIDSNSIVINGFSGQGLLSAILCQKAKQVVGIEINESSHISAEKLKTLNKLTNLKNICGDFYKHFKKEMKTANTIILDPTKKGCGCQVMNEINGIDNIIYISCNPIALSKDLNCIKNDYIIEEIVPFDMFPNTTSVETFVKLKRKNK